MPFFDNSYQYFCISPALNMKLLPENIRIFNFQSCLQSIRKGRLYGNKFIFYYNEINFY